MKTGLLLGLGAAALLGGGLWLGRSSTETPAAAPAPAANVRSAALPAVGGAALAARAPALPQPRRAAAAPGLSADLADSDPKIRRAAIREAARDPNIDPAILLAASRDPISMSASPR